MADSCSIHYSIENGSIKPNSADCTNEPEKKTKGAVRQFTIMAFLMISNFSIATVVSLQAPFYPAEAERKGATATEYGFVFAVYEMVALVVSPFYGKYMQIIGVNFLLKAGIFVVSTSCIIFGFLDTVYSHAAFIGLSITIRFVESFGGTAYFAASTAIVAQEFPEKIGSVFSATGMCFGLGLIVGPTIGGFLFQIGGFMLPFFSLGSFLFIIAIITVAVMPSLDAKKAQVTKGSWSMLFIFPVTLSLASIMCSAITITFLVATIEPHLRQFNLTPVWVGVYVVINGGIYAFTTNIWGNLSDKTGYTLIYCAVGAILICISYLFLGPAPFLPFNAKLWLCAVALAIHGLGQSAQLVCGFSGGIKAAVENGYPDDISTYGMVSSSFATSFALGACIGPSLGGILLDTIGFRNATMIILGIQASLALTILSHLSRKKLSAREKDGRLGTSEENARLLNKSQSV